jgi:3-hydroxybutyryl-CoA dehydratase
MRGSDSDDWCAVEQPVTQTEIDVYAELSEDYNPLHVDPAAAAASEFGGIVAHGPMALHPLLIMLEQHYGAGLRPGTVVDVVYRGPARPGDVVRADLDTVDVEADGRIALRVECRVDGRTVVSVRVRIPAGPAGA